MYLSCIQTAEVYLVWYFVVDTLFCLIPAASLSRCVWCLLVEWGTMAWLQALPWELPTEKVTSRIGPFLIFPFTVHVLFSFDFFYFDILIYKNRYYLLADVCLLSSCFFLNAGWVFFSFLFFQSGRFFSFSLRFFCMLSLFVVRLCSRWNQSIFQIIFGANPLSRFLFPMLWSGKYVSLMFVFFSICASFAWVVGLFVPDIVCQCFT